MGEPTQRSAFPRELSRIPTDPLFDPFVSVNLPDPYPGYRLLRERYPVYHVERRSTWVVSRYADVQNVSRDWKTFASSPSVDLDGSADIVGPGSFIDVEPPRHDALRNLVRSRFTAKTLSELAPVVADVCDRLIAEVSDCDEVDLALQFAWRLPVSTLCHLMGFPRKDVNSLTPIFRDLAAREPGSTVVPSGARQAYATMRDYLIDQMRDRRRRPSDDPTGLIVTAAEEERTLLPEEVFGLCYLLCQAGTSTTAGLIGNSLKILSDFPDQRSLLTADPGKIPVAVEEVLRYDAPVQYLARRATADVELHNVTIPADGRLVLLYGSANRDERRYPDPEVFDVTREPKRHLGFGEGIHFCLGAPLARLESRLFLERFLAAFPDYAVIAEGRRSTELTTRGYSSLPARLRRR